MAKSNITTVAVIGGGASGLATARCLLAAGLVPTVFEQAPQIGGVWSFDAALPEGGSPAYRSLHTNTPKQLTAFSDFPFRDELPDYPVWAEVVGYLRAYVDHFGLSSYIRCATHVNTVVPTDHGRWLVQVATPSGGQTLSFDAVCVCSGMFGEPRLPEYPGLQDFRGTLLHSRAYMEARPFAGQRVLVLGTGSSGSDIAVEVGQVARQVWLSGRNAAWLHPAPAPPPPPSEWRSRLARYVQLRLGLGAWRAQGHATRPDAPFMLEPDRPTRSARLHAAIQAGAVTPRPGIVRVDGKTITFTDGTREEVDTIICATGYALRFPFLDEEILRVTLDGPDLYRAVVHPDRPTLACIGLTLASGAIMPLAEIQARWVAQVLRGAIHLPPATQMRAAIAARRALVAARGGNPWRIAFEPYMDTLAAEIGALPRLERHPRLWGALLGGPPLAARYRLDGPGRAANAAAILRAGHPPAPTGDAPPAPIRDRSWSRG